MADDGLESFYDGELASRQASFLAEAGSPIDELDLRAHQADWAPPIETTYRGVRVTSHPPNSSGVSALELLNVWERFDPPAADRFGAGTAPDSRWVHLGVEAAKLVMRDRETHVTDPGFHNVPVSMLLDVEHATQLAGLIRTSQASTLPATTQPTGGGTAYLAVVDRDRNVVSLIQSNYLGFGSGVLDPMTGILYQNRGSYFSLDPDHVNVLQPGKRTLHTLLPTLLFRGDRPWIVTGSMGGDAQPQVVAQVVSDLTDGSLDIAAAIARPRWFVSPARQHAQVDEVKIEGHFGETICHELAAMGHPVRSMPAYSSELGECHAIEIMAPDPRERSGSLVATADPRSDGLPGVY